MSMVFNGNGVAFPKFTSPSNPKHSLSSCVFLEMIEMTRVESLTQTVVAESEAGEPSHMIIAGPCSAETEEQVMDTARQLADAGISYFRAGIWKPRTSPDSFEGVGHEALGWLKRVQQEVGLRTTVEVANARHVEAALEAGVDMLWIGARTTVNPFTVQEIADSLRGVKIPVMVKNPCQSRPRTLERGNCTYPTGRCRASHGLPPWI